MHEIGTANFVLGHVANEGAGKHEIGILACGKRGAAACCKQRGGGVGLRVLLACRRCARNWQQFSCFGAWHVASAEAGRRAPNWHSEFRAWGRSWHVGRGGRRAQNLCREFCA